MVLKLLKGENGLDPQAQIWFERQHLQEGNMDHS
jgi:hypothetical protein